jgi:hypothetical protein
MEIKGEKYENENTSKSESILQNYYRSLQLYSDAP